VADRHDREKGKCCLKGTMGGTGLEPSREIPQNHSVSAGGGTNSGTLGVNLMRSDLETLIDAWPVLPAAIRADILVLIRSIRKA
jgi:hypothetical protein